MEYIEPLISGADLLPVEYYDGVNGHIIKYLNTGISDIAYNLLNLPMTLAIANSFGGITQAWVQGITTSQEHNLMHQVVLPI